MNDSLRRIALIWIDEGVRVHWRRVQWWIEEPAKAAMAAKQEFADEMATHLSFPVPTGG